MKRKKPNRKIIPTALKLVLICGASKSFANPSGLTVSLGSATAQQLGSQLNVTLSQLAVLNWSSFNIAAGETTSFLQPSSSSIVFNVINGGNPSQIFGSLNANGTVILANANGLYFGPNSMVKVGGSFIATTAPLPPDIGSGSAWQFSGMPPLASIVNYGQIQVGQGQSLFLIAENIQNYGALSAPAGNVTLAAGQSVLVSDSPDGRGLSAQVQLPQGSVDNFGNITADAGTIAMQAQVVNQDGAIQANSAQDVNGTIELTASDTLNLDAGSTTTAKGNNVATGSGGVTLQAGNIINNSGSVVADGSSILANAPTINQNGTLQANSLGSINGAIAIEAATGLNLGAGSSILANGDATDLGASPGGFVVLYSPGSYSDSASSTVSVSGNSLGQGGVVEILNNNNPISANISGSYATFENPDALTLSTAPTSTSSSSPNLNASALLAYSDIYLYNLEFDSQWNIANVGATTTLNLNAMNDITFDNGSGIQAGQNWNLNLNAGQFFSETAPVSGNDNITLNGAASLRAQNGNINLWAGQNILIGSGSVLTTAGGGISLAANSMLNLDAGSTTSADGNNTATGSGGVTLQAGSTINNSGSVVADGSSILIEAPTVNQNGTLQANSLDNINGAIAIDAATGLNLGAGSSILATGDSTDLSASPGGFVVLYSPGSYSDSSSSAITVSGKSSGQGGVVEIINNNNPISATINGSYATFKNPNALKLSTATTSTSSSSANLNVNALPAYADIYLYNIEFSSQWNMANATAASTLNLNAMNNITFDNGSVIKAGQYRNLNLSAGKFFSGTTPVAGNDDIILNGTATLEGQNGNINLWAAQSILVGSGSIFTTSGGSIFAAALYGDVNAGTSNGGTSTTSQSSDYTWSSIFGGRPNIVLGGISTKAGGNVTLIAGDDIISVPAPVPAATDWPGASGTYGGGNVTLVAGNQITGNFNLVSGTGNIFAGVLANNEETAGLQSQEANTAAFQSALAELESGVTLNTSGSGNIGTSLFGGGVTLSLAQGSWNVSAANNIYVDEVNNPNGAFDSVQNFLFTYAANDAVNLWAGNAINLVGDDPIRYPKENTGMPPIYAPILTLNAGAGGITVDNSIILYPSNLGEGELQIITRDGGDLNGAISSDSSTLTGITMSDSSANSWAGSDPFLNHAATPLYMGIDTPVTVDISGSIENFGLTVPTYANINVVGNTYNFGFLGQNLSSDQTTYIDVGQKAKANMEKAGLLDPTTDGSLLVGGNITYRGDQTSQTLSDAITSAQFEQIINDNPSFAAKLSYDPTSGTLTYVGKMSATDESSLQNLLDASVVFTGSQLAAWNSDIGQLYTDTQSASLGDNGLALSGPGKFNIFANSIDLGISGGISVLAPDPALSAQALAAMSPYGANLKIKTTGDLDMTTSVIANEGLLGGITLCVGGTLDVGGELTPFGSADSPKGIFTTSGGSVSVKATDDVNVDGSRIAAYDGGSISVTSETGDINAGEGGSGYVALTALQLDPINGSLDQISATIPGSGILATTIFGSDAVLGNITLNAPNGSVDAQQGGVIQIAFNGNGTKDNFIQINAGDDINAQGSGIIGSNIKLTAGGNINGVVIGSQSIDINSAENVNVTAISGGNVDIDASGDISGTIVSGGSLDVSGSSIDASLIAESVSASGDVAGASMGIPQSNVTTENTPVADSATTASSKADSDDSDDEKKKRKPVALAQKVSRVTVTLPPKNNSRTQNQNSSPSS